MTDKESTSLLHLHLPCVALSCLVSGGRAKRSCLPPTGGKWLLQEGIEVFSEDIEHCRTAGEGFGVLSSSEIIVFGL